MKKFIIIIGIIGLIFLSSGIYAENSTSKATLQNEKITKLFDPKMLDKFEKDKKNIVENLKNSSKEQAIELFNAYYKNTSEYLYENGDTMLDKSVREKSFSENEMKQINENFLNKYGLKLYHAGEGTFAVRTYSNFYYDIFKDYLSDDYKEYLKIVVKESEEPFASDGGVIIPIDELGDRIIVWENFMKKYPNLDKKLKNLINKELLEYRNAYILGLDNTPTMDVGKILNENNIEFNRFIKKYPNSPTTEIIKYLQKSYQNKDIQNVIYKKIQKISY